MKSVSPVHLQLQPTRQALTVTWDDGHLSHYPYGYLRGFCPCAHCQQHRTDLRFVPEDHAAKLKDVVAVGNYAVQLLWQSQHRTGIYSFDYLRNLCFCNSCFDGNAAHPAYLLSPEQCQKYLIGFERFDKLQGQVGAS